MMFDVTKTCRFVWAESLVLPLQPVGFRVEDAEKWAIIRAIKHTQGNIRQAAKLLVIGKTTLYRKMRQHDILQQLKPEDKPMT